MWQTPRRRPRARSRILRRLMVKLECPSPSQTLVANATPAKKGFGGEHRERPAGSASEDGFDSAWRRVAWRWTAQVSPWKTVIASKASILCAMFWATAEGGEPGFFSRLFNGSSANTDAAKFQIALRSQERQTTVVAGAMPGGPFHRQRATHPGN